MDKSEQNNKLKKSMSSMVKLRHRKGNYFIVDSTGNVIIKNIHDAIIRKFYRKKEYEILFITEENEFSYINSSGLFFDKYSYKEFDMVCTLVPIYNVYYKIKHGNKYGLINESSNITTGYIFDKIESLRSNTFVLYDIVKLIKNGEVSLIHGRSKDFEESKKYNYIYTPIQPLDKFIICKGGNYGFIDAISFEEIVEPTFRTIEELCNYCKRNIEKYTKDLYITDTKLEFKKIYDPIDDYSYFQDINGILKGKWKECEEFIQDDRTGEVTGYNLLNSNINEKIRINMYGYFYNLFDSREYDIVIHAIANYYIVKKNDKYGLLDDEFHVILNICYKNIRMVHFSEMEDMPLFAVTDEHGTYLYNVETKMQTKTYDSLWWYNYSETFKFKNYLVYEEQGKFGLLSPYGEIISKAKYDLYKFSHDEIYGMRYDNNINLKNGHAYFQEIFHGHKYGFYIENNKFYGRISIDKFDTCIMKGGDYYYYITKVGGKYGLIDRFKREIKMSRLDDLIYADKDRSSIFHGFSHHSVNAPLSSTYLIGRIGNRYNLYSISFAKEAQSTLIVADCEEMEFIVEWDKLDYGIAYVSVRFKKNGVEGYVNEDGEIISCEIYDEVKQIEAEGFYFYLIYRKDKVGLLDYKRKIIFPCQYDDIVDIEASSAKIIESGIERIVKYSIYRPKYNVYNNPASEECDHYSEYAGSYAQEEMGYSDEDIDTIFDGDPDAYWNID